jgi:hypothetical protein
LTGSCIFYYRHLRRILTEATINAPGVVSTQIRDLVTGRTPVDLNGPIVVSPEVSGHCTGFMVFSI